MFDSGDLRVTMKEGSTWTFNPECCTLLSEEAAAAAANGDAATNDEGESSSDDEDEDSIQITRMLSTLAVHNHPKTITVLTRFRTVVSSLDVATVEQRPWGATS